MEVVEYATIGDDKVRRIEIPRSLGTNAPGEKVNTAVHVTFRRCIKHNFIYIVSSHTNGGIARRTAKVHLTNSICQPGGKVYSISNATRLAI